jgi:putative ABC transport system permease protein
MNALSLALASIRARPLQSALCVLASAAGFALLAALFLLSQAIAGGFERNAEGVDVVAGAKGSPLQLVLSSVYHADVPTGNIEAADAEKIAHNPKVRLAIPLALGDSYRGYRIVGTTPDYLKLYGAVLADGKVFAQPFEAVAGAFADLKTGAHFFGVHGLSIDADDVHRYHEYKIIGKLKPTGTVLDRLILTPVESVQELHKHPDAGDPDAAEELKIGHQVTALLLQVKNPIAVMTLPRELNKDANLLAASPGLEMTRLAVSLGVGRDLLAALGAGFVALSTLMLLSSLASGLAARRYDLSVLRVLGASPLTLSCTVIAEGAALSLAGALLGLALGHLFAYAVAAGVDSLRGLVLAQAMLRAQAMDAQLLALGLVTGLLGGLLPAWSAARTDIASLLAKGRT